MTTISLSAATLIRRDPDTIFRELHDPNTLVRCVTGATLTRITGPRTLGVINFGIGPIRSEYRGRGRIVASDPRRRTASLELTGEPSAILATYGVRMWMAIVEHRDGSQIRMSFDIELPDRLPAGGWLEAFACDLVDRAARRMKQLLEELPVPALSRDAGPYQARGRRSLLTVSASESRR